MRFFVKVSLFVCFALTAFAQGERGTITGTVSDPAGAVVPAAAISAKNTETGATYNSETTATGNYTLNSLPPGLYDVTASAAGFSRSVEQGLRVNVAMTIRVDVVLKIGSATESITITDDALKRLVEPLRARTDAAIIITADHGNAEELLDPLTGGEDTQHSTRNVPAVFIAAGLEASAEKGKSLESLAQESPIGTLVDIAPSALYLLGIDKPNEMTGSRLITA